MIHILDKKKCCGCSACLQKCPKQCISMSQDNEGFLYPVVDMDKCIDCGMCEKVCPFLNPYEKKLPHKTLAAINKDDGIRMQSSSGGVFTVIAEQIINEGGVVFGARFDNNWQVILDYTETIEGLELFRGSKYVQASVGKTFILCDQFLRAGRKVLYTGSPCQISGLKHYLKKDYENLYTVDFVCHGVPSPKVWNKYLHEVINDYEGLNRKGGAGNSLDLCSPNYHDVITGINFREKGVGWKKFRFVLTFAKNTSGSKNSSDLSSGHTENPYMKSFLKDFCLRPSCHDCKVKGCSSNSDMTIGDFWGIDNLMPEIDDDKGVSVVLLHNTRMSHHFESKDLIIRESTYDDACKINTAIIQSSSPNPKRTLFFNMLDSGDRLSQIVSKLTKVSLAVRVLRKISNFKNIKNK